jgi:ParB family chromosome partitioning protein
MKLDYIDLDRLSVSDANMRSRDKNPNLANILPSVRKRGVLVPLLVRPNGEPDHFEIVAGRRRYLSAKVVAEEGGAAGPLPCRIMEAGDDAAALEASLIENVARLDPDEVAQWGTFSRLVREGRTIEDIAATFGVTEQKVRRVLALGNLTPRIRNLYRSDMIDVATVRHLTLATKAQQRDWLRLYDSPESYAPTGHRLKEWLFGGQAIPTTSALFDLVDYPGPIVADLFGGDSYFGDTEAFWTLQRSAIEAKRQSHLDAGWKQVDILEPGSWFQKWEYEKRAKSKGGRVYLTVSARGEVEAHEGWFPHKEARKEAKGEGAPKPERSLISAPLQNYIDLHQHAAVRAKLLDHPNVALRLMLAHAIVGSVLWNVRPDPQRADKPATAESVETSVSEAAFDQKRRAALAFLDFDPEALTLVRGGQCAGIEEVFERLLCLADEEVLAILSIVMGETLEAGAPVVKSVGVPVSIDMATAWQVDEAFFDLVRGRELLKAMVAEVAGDGVAAANAGESGKALKFIIKECISEDGARMARTKWVPSWLAIPPISGQP